VLTLPPARFFVPNAFTAISLLVGLASAVCSSQGDFELAAWMIVWGTLLDKADGTAARILKATSGFGVEFDSFADFISFGVAPAALYYFSLSAAGASRPLAGAAAGLYAIALAVRLARFNLLTGDTSVFQGVPGTLMGGVLACAHLAFSKHHLLDGLLGAAPAILLVAAVLMVSNLRLPKLKAGKNKAVNVFLAVSVAASAVLAVLRLFPEALLGISTFVLLAGLVAGARHTAPPSPEHALTMGETPKPPPQASPEA
jgi:CDP-diacylglycerol--serine O-phosphatidyltransferase